MTDFLRTQQENILANKDLKKESENIIKNMGVHSDPNLLLYRNSARSGSQAESEPTLGIEDRVIDPYHVSKDDKLMRMRQEQVQI